MGESQNSIKEVLSALVRSNARFVTLSDLCEQLKFGPEDCEQALQSYLERGLLRITHSNGEAYFWLTQQLAD